MKEGKSSQENGTILSDNISFIKATEEILRAKERTLLTCFSVLLKCMVV